MEIEKKMVVCMASEIWKSNSIKNQEWIGVFRTLKSLEHRRHSKSTIGTIRGRVLQLMIDTVMVIDALHLRIEISNYIYMNNLLQSMIIPSKLIIICTGFSKQESTRFMVIINIASPYQNHDVLARRKRLNDRLYVCIFVNVPLECYPNAASNYHT